MTQKIISDSIPAPIRDRCPGQAAAMPVHSTFKYYFCEKSTLGVFWGFRLVRVVLTDPHIKVHFFF